MNSGIFRGYLQLCRPANLPTAAADIIAGLAISGMFVRDQIMNLGFGNSIWIWTSLVAASVFLYAGGVVLNDVFDAELDQIERPERPIPSGLIPKSNAAILGAFLLVVGILLAAVPEFSRSWIALMLASSILVYDGFAKKFSVLGPLFMGLCRGINLWLGMFLFGFEEALPFIWIPVIYIFAITSVSRGEVAADNRNQIILAGILYAIAIFGVAVMMGTHGKYFWSGIPFLLFFAGMVFFPLIKAYQDNTAMNVRHAVKAGVLGLVVMNSAWVAGFSGWVTGILILCLLPLSAFLSKKFAIT